MTSPPRAWAEIDLAALDRNLAFIREHSGQSIMAILKAGAYGHGLPELARHLERQKLPYFGVANVGEARRLTRDGIETPLYLLGPTFPDEREEIVLNQWTPSLSSLAEIEHFQELCRIHSTALSVHLTVDTGMGRGGFLPHQLSDALAHLAKNSHLHLAGIGSHLPSADEDPEFTQKQFSQFDRLIESNLEVAEQLRGPNNTEKPLFIHLSNGAGLLDYCSTTTNLVRPGLLLYGVSPLPDYQSRVTPVMSLKSRVALIRTLPKGHGVSYGRSHILSRETEVATIGIGYGDGLPRNLSSQDSYVLIRGKKAPLLGRVTMDQIMVDVSEFDSVVSGDEVEIFGPNLSVIELARWSGTIAWEVLTRITPRVERRYLAAKTD